MSSQAKPCAITSLSPAPRFCYHRSVADTTSVASIAALMRLTRKEDSAAVVSALCRAVMGAVLRAGREMRAHGTFTFAAVSYRDISAMFETVYRERRIVVAIKA
jgi:hypothetical protein